MLHNKLSLVGIGLFWALSQTPLMALEISQAETIPNNCQLLKEVSTGETQITKKIESLGITNNFNTDFAVPTGVNFTSYQAMMRVENDANYKVKINLKDASNAVSTVYEKELPMTRGEVYSLPFQTPTKQQPYQVNFNVGGPNNNTYTISVMACQ